MPQRGYGLQPRVAASATLGKEAILSSTATRLRLCAFLSEKNDATALRLEFLFLLVPRVAEAATLGCRPMPRWGITENVYLIILSALTQPGRLFFSMPPSRPSVRARV